MGKYSHIAPVTVTVRRSLVETFINAHREWRSKLDRMYDFSFAEIYKDEFDYFVEPVFVDIGKVVFEGRIRFTETEYSDFLLQVAQIESASSREELPEHLVSMCKQIRKLAKERYEKLKEMEEVIK